MPLGGKELCQEPRALSPPLDLGFPPHTGILTLCDQFRLPCLTVPISTQTSYYAPHVKQTSFLQLRFIPSLRCPPPRASLRVCLTAHTPIFFLSTPRTLLSKFPSASRVPTQGPCSPSSTPQQDLSQLATSSLLCCLHLTLVTPNFASPPSHAIPRLLLHQTLQVCQQPSRAPTPLPTSGQVIVCCLMI